MLPMKRKTPIELAVKHFKTKTALATALGVKPCYVGKMVRENHVPWQQCKKIEALTGGLVTARQLNPKVFAE